MFPGSIGPMEVVLVLVIALVVLGPKKLPDVARSVGRGMREFKDAIAGADPRRHDDDAEFPGLDGPGSTRS
ncbi:MAG: twin-arginine translocase TatA/TatE family subunit [Solirubrobacteraceae bacterium]|nr:twin-arginine translocase TatA/TatE family subunit [Solirubrobacteraceae bacterium]